MFQAKKIDRYLILTLAVPLLYCSCYLIQGKLLLKGNSDAVDHHVPFFIAINDAVKTDIIPKWTRFIFTGYSLASFPIWQWYPPNWVSFVVPKDYIPYTVTITAWLHFLGVAWVAFIYFRELSRSSYWASVCAVAYTFSLPVMYGLTTIVSQLPFHLFTLLALYVIHTSANRSWKLTVVYVALTTFAIATGAFFHFALYCIPLIFLYSIVIGVFGTETYTKDSRVILYCLGGIALGLLLLAPMLLPSFTMSLDTSRDYYTATMPLSDIYRSIKIDPIFLWRLFSPNAFGCNILFQTGTTGGINYVESMNAFCGVIMLFLAGYAMTASRSPIVIFWSIVFVGMVLFTMTPLVYIHSILFGHKFICNRVTLLLPLAITSLAAIAGQHIDSENRMSLRNVILNPFWLLLIIAAECGIPKGEYLRVEIIWATLSIYTLILCGLYLCEKGKFAWHLIIFCLVSIGSVWSGHLMTTVQDYPLMVSPEGYYTFGALDKSPLYAKSTRFEQYRVALSEIKYGTTNLLGAREANQGLVYGYASPWGYGSAFSSRLAFLVDRLAGLDFARTGGGHLVCFKAETLYNNRLADLTSVGFVMDPDNRWLTTKDRRETCLPRASLFYEYEPCESREEAVKILKGHDFPIKRKVILTSTFDTPIGPSDIFPEVEFLKNANSSIVIEVKTKTPAILLLTDVFDEGWVARVDGKRVDIMEGNVAFRAVYVPRGKHVVEFKYCPPALRLSLLLSLMGISVCVMLYKTRLQ